MQGELKVVILASINYQPTLVHQLNGLDLCKKNSKYSFVVDLSQNTYASKHGSARSAR